MRRRTLLAGISAIAAAAALAPRAFAAIPDKIEQPIEVSFSDYNLATAGLGAEATKQMIAEFEALNPLIKVNGIAASDTTGRVQSDLAAGKTADLAQIVFSELDFVVDN